MVFSRTQLSVKRGMVGVSEGLVVVVWALAVRRVMGDGWMEARGEMRRVGREWRALMCLLIAGDSRLRQVSSPCRPT